jgi:hypothetical protein
MVVPDTSAHNREDERFCDFGVGDLRYIMPRGTLTAIVVILLIWAGITEAAEDESYNVIWTSAGQEIVLSGDEDTWSPAHAIRWGPAKYPTIFRAMWTERGLYIRFDVTDDDPWYRHTDRDDPLWEEEVVEIFLDPNRTGTNYAEIELSPGGAVCDVRMLAGEPKKEIDLDWNLEGLTHRVHMNHGSKGQTIGWTAIALLPWVGFESLPPVRDVELPPRTGDRWRFNVFRIERPGGRDAPNLNVIFAAWSKTPGRSFHVPAVFRYLEFVKE